MSSRMIVHSDCKRARSAVLPAALAWAALVVVVVVVVVVVFGGGACSAKAFSCRRVSLGRLAAESDLLFLLCLFVVVVVFNYYV